MRYVVMFFTLFVMFITVSMSNDVIFNLKNRLNKNDNLYVNFKQKVIDSSGNKMQENRGELWVKRPIFFYWHVHQPDESILVSDGKALWFYDPLINQVTVNCLKDVIDSTPFMFIINNKINKWLKFNIKQNGDDFILIPKSKNVNLKEFIINVNQNGIIHRFSAIEQDNQRDDYELYLQRNDEINISQFTFVPPKGVMIDDQRNYQLITKY